MSGQEKDATFTWNELATRDTAKVGAFFSELLGWTIETVDMPQGPYMIFKKGETMTGGMMDMAQYGVPDGTPPHWLSYIQVPDVDASAAKVTELGGTVAVPPTDIPNVGRFCVITDPAGAYVALMTMAQTDC